MSLNLREYLDSLTKEHGLPDLLKELISMNGLPTVASALEIALMETSNSMQGDHLLAYRLKQAISEEVRL